VSRSISKHYSRVSENKWDLASGSPKRDRSGVLKEWTPSDAVLLDLLPLNYDETTIRTIEQIAVIWLKRRAIVRAFEVEHTTAVYSGILRMADLLALQPNMDINLGVRIT
jgi:hypothetical protein